MILEFSPYRPSITKSNNSISGSIKEYDSSIILPSPTAKPKRDLSRLYTQIRSFHTTFMVRLFKKQRYSQQFTYSLHEVGLKDVTCFDMILNSPNKFKKRMKTRQNLGRNRQFRKARRSSAFMYKPRQNSFSRKYNYIVNTMYVFIIYISYLHCIYYIFRIYKIITI